MHTEKSAVYAIARAVLYKKTYTCCRHTLNLVSQYFSINKTNLWFQELKTTMDFIKKTDIHISETSGTASVMMDMMWRLQYVMRFLIWAAVCSHTVRLRAPLILAVIMSEQKEREIEKTERERKHKDPRHGVCYGEAGALLL